MTVHQPRTGTLCARLQSEFPRVLSPSCWRSSRPPLPSRRLPPHRCAGRPVAASLRRAVGQRSDEEAGGENLQNQQKIFSEEPADPRGERTLLQHPLPKKERRGAYLKSFGLEAVE